MSAGKVGSLAVWGVVIAVAGIGNAPKAFAQDVHAQTIVSPPAQSVIPGTVQLAGMRDETGGEETLLAVVVPPSRFGFERLRRMLPYGTIHDPVTRYLTDDQLNAPEDY